MPEIQQFRLPDAGEGLTEAEILTWRVKPGDTVKVNDPIVEIETAKSVVELPSPYAGVVTELLVPEGVTVDVGTPIIAVDTAPRGGAPPPPAAPGAAAAGGGPARGQAPPRRGRGRPRHDGWAGAGRAALRARGLRPADAGRRPPRPGASARCRAGGARRPHPLRDPHPL